MRASPEQIAAMERLCLERGGTVQHSEQPPRAEASVPARGRTKHTPGRMNKTEEKHARELTYRIEAGEVAAFWFESVKLRLADRTWYTPDFCVILADGTIQFHEVKGHMEDDAAVKLKVVAEMYPAFTFLLYYRGNCVVVG